MIVADTSGIFASVDSAAAEHKAVTAILAEVDEPPLVTPFVVAEVDYLLTTRFGTKTAITFLQDVADGAYELVEFHPGDLGTAVGVVQRYADLNIGVTDASLVVAAARYGTTDLLSLDERHFRVIAPLWGAAFRLLPADY
jgi:predicted nucleic acid-binding protein